MKLEKRILLTLCALLAIPGAIQANEQAIEENIGAIADAPLAVQEVTFHSKAVDRLMAFNVVLPKDYASSGQHYPVLYLLHGLTANYQEWKYLGVPKYLNRHDLIVVMVDAGNSWYVDWAKTTDGRKNKWDEYVSKELVGYVDSHYRTIAKREGRAINGLSMGGYGAISVGLRHPDLYCSIASHSGAISWAREQGEAIEKGGDVFYAPEESFDDETSRYLGVDVEGFSSQKVRTPRGEVFSTKEDADANDPFKLVLKIPANQRPHIYFDCGYEDFLLEASQGFVKLLMEHEIPFTFGQSGGGHEEAYWWREVGVSMAVQYAIIQRNLMGGDYVEPEE